MAEKTFTEALNILQKAASDIGKQATSLEDSLRLYEEGIKEAAFCKEILDSAEQRILIYQNGGEIDA